MSTSKDYIDYVISCLDPNLDIRSRKMFGEYMVYIHDKPLLLVCDNTVFVKIIPELESVLGNSEKGYPYDGAKIHYILDIENKSLIEEVINILYVNTEIKKPKSKKVLK